MLKFWWIMVPAINYTSSAWFNWASALAPMGTETQTDLWNSSFLLSHGGHSGHLALSNLAFLAEESTPLGDTQNMSWGLHWPTWVWVTTFEAITGLWLASLPRVSNQSCKSQEQRVAICQSKITVILPKSGRMPTRPTESVALYCILWRVPTNGLELRFKSRLLLTFCPTLGKLFSF